MESKKIRRFMELAGQRMPSEFSCGDERTRCLGAQLLLSEVLEYVIHGLGVIPEYEGVPITKPNGLTYQATAEPDRKEMLDGLADVAYTMYWNSEAFAIPLEEGFELVCDNNLNKFVRLTEWQEGERVLECGEWGCGQGIEWDDTVVEVCVVEVDGQFYGVGKDKRGKVRKPSSYQTVDLSSLLKEVVNG